MDKLIRQLGRWTWDATSNELRREGETVRLQQRAARTLDLLIDRMGQVVSREQIVAQVWDGRTVSGNSVPMVIGQLRKALGTGDGCATLETIPKRGYRLLLPDVTSDTTVEERPSRRPATVFGIALVAVAVLLALLMPGVEGADTVALLPLRDETGDPAYRPLAKATDALLVSRLGNRGVELSRVGDGANETIVSKLVLWDKRPFLALQAERKGVVVWSAMIDSAGGGFPQNLEPKLDEWSERRED